MKLSSHPYHKPWKSLRDSHIPSALRLIISIQFSKPKRSLPQLPNPLTFRLIFQLEKTEGLRIYLVTMSERFCLPSRRLIVELEQHGADAGEARGVRQETRSSASSETRNTSSRMMRSVASFR
jgi:hypothetical protein